MTILAFLLKCISTDIQDIHYRSQRKSVNNNKCCEIFVFSVGFSFLATFTGPAYIFLDFYVWSLFDRINTWTFYKGWRIILILSYALTLKRISYAVKSSHWVWNLWSVNDGVQISRIWEKAESAVRSPCKDGWRLQANVSSIHTFWQRKSSNMQLSNTVLILFCSQIKQKKKF